MLTSHNNLVKQPCKPGIADPRRQLLPNSASWHWRVVRVCCYRQAMNPYRFGWQMIRRSTLALAVGCAIALTTPVAMAADFQNLDRVRQLVSDFVQQNARDLGGRVQITVGVPDDRLRLPDCPTAIAELPDGQRLWGWTQVRVRCPVEGGWSLNLRTRVQVLVPALITRKPLQPGQPIDVDDVQPGEADLTAGIRMPLGELDQVLGRVVRIGLTAGQVLSAEQIRLPVIVRSGMALQVTATAGQVSATGAGTALQDGALGDIVRFKVPSGRTLQGVVVGEGRVRIQMQ